MAEQTTDQPPLPDDAGPPPPVTPPAPPVGAAQQVSPPRENMITTAMKFLQNPQVQSSPLSQRRAFLKKKGLTEDEINIAVQRSGVTDPAPAAQPPVQGQMVPMGQPMPPQPPPPPPRSTLAVARDYAALTVLIGGISYAIYRLIQKFILPLFTKKKEEEERLERIENAVADLNSTTAAAVREIEKSVTAMQALMERQEIQLEQIAKDVLANKVMATTRGDVDTTQIRSEISSLKGILLSRHQFPASPQPKSIPSWQLQGANPSPLSATPTKSTPPQEEETPKVKKEDLSHHRVNGTPLVNGGVNGGINGVEDEGTEDSQDPPIQNGGSSSGLVNGDVAEEDMNIQNGHVGEGAVQPQGVGSVS